MVKAASTASASSLLKLVEKSGLLADRQDEVQALAASSEDARSFARQLVLKSLVTKWQAAQLLNGFYQFNLGKYRLLDQIGVGRIGREFLAEHVQLSKRVAIKLVSRNLTTDAERLKQFLAESRRAVSLDHPHLVHSFDVDQEGQRYYVVTEFVDGEDLEKRIKRSGPCSQAEALSFIRQAAEGLQHAQVSGVLHGDLKPSNLLIDKQGSLKVADLGFARLVDGAPKAQPAPDSQEQNLQEGIEYCAPEAINSTEGDLDCRADMYSLGQTLYFLVKGAKPIPAPATPDERKALIDPADANSPLAELFAALTAPDAKERPATWKEVIERLRAVEAKIGPPAPPKRKQLVAQAITLPDSQAVAAVELPEDSTPVASAEHPVVLVPRSKGDESASKQPSASGDSEAKKSLRPTRSKKVDPRLVIGMVAGGGVVMLLITAGILWALLGRNNTQVAENPKDKHAAQAGTETKSHAEESPETEEETNPEVNPEANPEPAATTNEQPAAKTNEAGATAPVTTVAATVKPEAQPQPMPEPVPQPESKPAPTPESTPTPEPAKPELTKSETKPDAPPMPVGKPFEKLPATVTLPEISKPGEALTLGELALPPQNGLRIVLRGGEGAARNKTFTMQGANADTDERNWEVLLQGVLVAKLHREPDKLTFEWTPEAADQAGAANLCNCLLQLSAGMDQRSVALRTPIEVDPEVINLEKTTKWVANIDNLPSDVKVELIGLDPNAFPNPEFKTETTGKIKGEVMWYGEGLDMRNLGLLIDRKETGGKRVEVSLTPVYRMDAFAKDTMAAQKLNKRFLPQQAGFLDQTLKSLTLQSAAIDKAGGTAEQKEQAKNLINVDIKRLQDQLQRINSAATLVQKAHDTAVIHIRVSYDTGDGKVVLAQTKGAPPPEAEPAKPEAPK